MYIFIKNKIPMKYSKEKLLFDLCMLDKNLPIMLNDKQCDHIQAYLINRAIFLDFNWNLTKVYSFDLRNLMLTYPDYKLQLRIYNSYIDEYFIKDNEIELKMKYKC